MHPATPTRPDIQQEAGKSACFQFASRTLIYEMSVFIEVDSNVFYNL